MNCFHGFHNPTVLFLFFVGFPAAGNKPLLELSSRDDAVKMAGYGEQKLSTVLVTGSVHCEAIRPRAWPIQGALAAINCHSHGREMKDKSMVARNVTDEFGDFVIDLPSYLHATPNLEKICSLRIHRIPKRSHCRPVYVQRHKGHKRLRLSSYGNGIRTYSAGNIRLQQFL